MPWPPTGYHFHCASCGFYVCNPVLGEPVPAPGVTVRVDAPGFTCDYCGGDIKTGLPLEALRIIRKLLGDQRCA